MNLNSIVESAVTKVLFGEQKEHISLSSTMRIVVLDRGWVVVGNVSHIDGWTIIEDASVIRNWGTTKGLGEIAENGPTEKTVLDKCPTVRARTVIMEMDCEASKWLKR